MSELPTDQPHLNEVKFKLPVTLTPALMLELGGFLTRHDVEISAIGLQVDDNPAEAVGDVGDTDEPKTPRTEIDFPYKKDMTTTIIDQISGNSFVAVTLEDLQTFATQEAYDTKLATRTFSALLRGMPQRRVAIGVMDIDNFVRGHVKGDDEVVKGEMQWGMKVESLPFLKGIDHKPNYGKKSVEFFRYFCDEILSPPEEK